MECKLKKISEGCGCSPWYENQVDLPLCNSRGNNCVLKAVEYYHDELKDIKGCDCKDNCETHNFFTSMNFVQREFTDSKYYYDEVEHTGILANYLLDPKHFFHDYVISNLTRLLYNLTGNGLAQRRFREDISILNFYFDTPLVSKLTLEMRMTLFDQIAAVGGSLGLFTGISIISMVEVVYWLAMYTTAFLRFRFKGLTKKSKNKVVSSAGKKNHQENQSEDHLNPITFVRPSTTRRASSVQAHGMPQATLNSNINSNDYTNTPNDYGYIR
jgi:hypothetical protein